MGSGGAACTTTRRALFGRRPQADAPDRRIAQGLSVRGQPDDEGSFAARRLHRRASACGHLHEAGGHPSVVSQAEQVETGTRPQGLSLSAAKTDGDAPEPSLGDGHHLHPDGAGGCLSRRCAGLGHPEGSGLAAVDDAGNRTVHRGFERSDALPWQTGDHEYGSGQPISHPSTSSRR